MDIVLQREQVPDLVGIINRFESSAKAPRSNLPQDSHEATGMSRLSTGYGG